MTQNRDADQRLRKRVHRRCVSFAFRPLREKQNNKTPLCDLRACGKIAAYVFDPLGVIIQSSPTLQFFRVRCLSLVSDFVPGFTMLQHAHSPYSVINLTKRRQLMMKKVRTFSSAAGILGVLISITLFALPADLGAGANVVPIEGTSYNVTMSLTDNLKSFIGKRVTVTLGSGSAFTGLVKEVGDHLAHLEKLEGKDFFDALICIENITAIEARFREYQR